MVDTVQDVALNTKNKKQFRLPVSLWVKDKNVQVVALVDSDADTMFINRKVVKDNNLEYKKLANSRKAYNIDGTENKGGAIDAYVKGEAQIGSYKSMSRLFVTDLGNKEMIIGYDFLERFNPQINWRNRTWKFPKLSEQQKDNREHTKSSVAQEESNNLEIKPTRDDFLDFEEEVDPVDRTMSWVTSENDKLDINTIVHEYTKPDKRPWWDIKNFTQTYTKPDPPPVWEDWDDDDDEVEEQVWKQHVPEELWGNGKVFSLKKSERLPKRKAWDHGIEFINDAELPKASKPIPLPPMERNSLDDWIDEELRKGYIRKSKSPLAAPVFFVMKKNGKLRLCTDYRRLNDITIKNKYPLPRMSELLDSLSKARVFTKMDLRWGYTNVRMKENDIWKAAFITHRGLFEPRVMYFGLTNAPATFQRMMNDLLKKWILAGKLVVYLDDILIYTDSLEENRQITKEVLQVLTDNDLFVNSEKSTFFTDKIEYLGTIVSYGQASMDPEKVKGVTEWPVPTRVKHVQAFLGLANFYRRFIKDFAKHAKPLTILTKKDQKWFWGDAQQRAFDGIKQSFVEAPILKIPDDINPFRLETDASDFATGAVLSQYNPETELWHPVSFYSKSLNSCERNYDIYDKELLAIIRALDEYRHHLEGHPEVVEIWSDHKNLTYFKSAQKLTHRQARWALFLTRFNFTLTHKPGSTMTTADPLSRRPDHGEGVDGDNEERILLRKELFTINAIDINHDTLINDEKILEDIKTALLDDKVTKGYQDLLQSGRREFKKSLEDWNYEDGLLFRRGKIYIPKDKNDELRQSIIKMHHDLPSAGHTGRWKTCELVSRNYWWPNLTIDVKRYVKGCDICQRMKNRPQKPYGPLMPNPIPNEPWEIISMDFITQLPESNGYTAICVVVCRLTKRARFFAIKNEITAKDIAILLFNKVWSIHGLPIQIISDRGTQFAAEVFQEWCKLLGIKSSMSTAYHPD